MKKILITSILLLLVIASFATATKPSTSCIVQASTPTVRNDGSLFTVASYACQGPFSHAKVFVSLMAYNKKLGYYQYVHTSNSTSLDRRHSYIPYWPCQTKRVRRYRVLGYISVTRPHGLPRNFIITPRDANLRCK